MAFQIRDDLLPYTTTTAALSDVANRQPTLARTHLSGLPPSASRDRLAELADIAVDRAHCRSRVSPGNR
ncbi:hypothetical protein NLX83_22010 [Allokutzneria sp. A3M-2-11 16]|nr:hypothetical protein [Allokutzneria sp. A3M-2-11 16]